MKWRVGKEVSELSKRVVAGCKGTARCKASQQETNERCFVAGQVASENEGASCESN